MRTSRPGALAALLVTAIASGAVAGVLTACFLWLVQGGERYFWTTLPDRVGVDPYGSWWLYAIPLAGGVLVGLGHRYLGNYPEPIQDVVQRWKAGGHVEPRTVPASVYSSLSALVTGGPVGFEAALTGLIGGVATWIGRRIGAVGRLVREAWGAERVDGLPRAARNLPYWLAAVGGLFAYKWLPFGQLDADFRFTRATGSLGVADALVAFAFAAVVCVPSVWIAALVRRSEGMVLNRRSPVLVAMGGALVFSTMAIGSQYVLFSGQQGIQHLIGLGTVELLYLTVAKWVALVVAFATGWRGGPVFPLFFAVSSLAVLVADPLGVAPEILMIAGIAAISAVFLRGSVPAAFVLSLYVVPLAHAAVILIGALGAASALTVARGAGILPVAPDDAPPPAPAV